MAAPNTPHGKWDSFPWVDFPEYAGTKSVIYRSKNGNIVAGAAHETGKHNLVYPCDEFFIVTKGWVTCDVVGGDTFTLKEGEVVFMEKGTEVNFEFSDDFYNVAIFIGKDGEKVTLV